MEAALVSVSMGVMKPLVSKLSNLLAEEHSKLKGVEDQVNFLRDEMSTMSATLQMLADAEELNPQIKGWRDKVRELSYDMEDCLDDFMARADLEHGGPSGLKGFLDKLKKLKPRHEIAGEIKELKKRAMEASNRHKRYKIDRLIPDSSTSSIDPRLHALYVEVDKLVGIDGPKKHIIKWFEKESSSSQLKVVSIAGLGGLGKTTLANQVYHTIKGQFKCAAFVSVSRKPDMKSILREIAKGVKADDTLDDDVQPLIDKLRGHLKDKRYFVVIADVWDTEAWKTIRLALLNNDHGSRIITTTRNIAVASYCSQGDYVYGMEPLSFIDSKRLFFNRVFGSEDLCYPHLEKVSDGILRKCAGLPLAIITLSSLLANQNAEDEWNRVLAAIGSGLAKDPNAEKMTKILYLSYFDLPHHLRSCLLYLSIFPEDHLIKKQRLIGRWIAEGLIHEEQGRSTFEVGEVYFYDLINRSLIHPVDVECGRANACRVHDIVLDFIRCIAAEENFVTSFDAADHGHVSDYRVRRLCVENHNIEQVTISTALILSHVRSLTIFGRSVQNSLLAFPALRVLDLGECSELESHQLANIEKLILLKYLRLRLTSTNEIPRKIGELQYLETLDLRGIEITELPSTITRLQRLSRLYVIQGTKFPSGVIGQLKNLEELEEFGVFSNEQVESLREFSQLSKLRTLKVAWGIYWSGDSTEGRIQSDFQSYVGTLISSCNLHHLHIFSTLSPAPRRVLSLELWCLPIPCSLRKLQITHCYMGKVPNWMSSLGNLRELSLCIFSVTPEDVAILGAIPTLLFLELKTFYGTKGRILIPGFRSLKYFDLQILRCGTLLQFEVGSMPKLECLNLEFPAHKIECMNVVSDFGIQHLYALTKVEVVLWGNFNYESNSDPVADMVASLIKTVVDTLPKHPTFSLLIHRHTACLYFSEFVDPYEAPTKRIGSFRTEKECRQQARAGETEQEMHVSRLRVLKGKGKEILQDATKRLGKLVAEVFKRGTNGAS